MLEIQAGQLAQQQAQDPEARAYAQRMVQEHTRNSQKLMSLAQSKGIAPPRELTSKHQAMLDKLQRAQGAQFDEAYGKLMAASHKDTLQTFERAQKKVQDPQLSAYIRETLPTLQDHHAEAKTLPGAGRARQAMGGSAGGENSSGGGSSSGGTSGSTGSGSMGGSSGGSGSMGGTSSSSSGAMGGSSSSSGSMGGSSSSSSGGTSSMGGSSSTPGGSSTSGTTPPSGSDRKGLNDDTNGRGDR